MQGGSQISRQNSTLSQLSGKDGKPKDGKSAMTIPTTPFPLNSIPKEALINCTFSFTIRRDAYHSQ